VSDVFRIKQLEWKKERNRDRYTASTPFGLAEVAKDDDGKWSWRVPCFALGGNYNSAKRAKEAVQGWFEDLMTEGLNYA